MKGGVGGPRGRGNAHWGGLLGSEERQVGWGTLHVPFRSHRKLQRMGMVKSLSTSQVLPYNLSQKLLK